MSIHSTQNSGQAKFDTIAFVPCRALSIAAPQGSDPFLVRASTRVAGRCLLANVGAVQTRRRTTRAHQHRTMSYSVENNSTQCKQQSQRAWLRIKAE